MDAITTYRIFAGKTFKEKENFWTRNLFFTVLPLLFFLLYFVLISGSDTINTDSSYNLNTVLQKDDLTNCISRSYGHKIYFVPNNTFFTNFMEKFRLENEILEYGVVGFPNEDYAWSVIGDLNARSYFIKFDEDHGRKFSYAIRTKSNDFHTDKHYSKNLHEMYDKTFNEYVDSGFLGLQLALDTRYLESISVDTSYQIELERLPKPSQLPRLSRIDDVGLYMIIFSVLISISLIFTRLVEEKTSGFREQLKNVTHYSYLNNFALFTINAAQMFGLFIVCFLITCMSGIWFSVNVCYAVLLIALYVISILSFTFLVSAFFEHITFSTVGAIFWFFVPFFCYQLATFQWQKVLIIFPVNAFYQAFQIFHDFTNSGHYFSGNNFFQFGHPNDNNFALSTCVFWLITSSFLSLFLYFYTSNVWPGKYGIKQSPCFMFTKSYYFPNQVKIGGNIETLNYRSEKNFEDFSHLSQKAVVKIRNLTKTFGKTTAVKNFSMDIFKNQITVLLGQNGSGKTTLISIMTGLIPKTSGHVYVDGNDNVQAYQSKIGYCPQHNISLPYMTCNEHLEFFGRLRGLTLDQAKDEATNILSKVHLRSKKDEVAKKLSGGMLRKLNLANAIIGNTKLLILDEPSSGLDPESRRDIWNIILKLKKNHTILITTHIMEEADVLGNKIAIIENGELISYGTSMFLKRNYGSGYILKMQKSSDKDSEFDKTSVQITTKRHIPYATNRTTVESLHCLTLPYEDKNQYGEMLRELEMNQTLLGIESMSISNTTMDEVFLNSASAENTELLNEVDAGGYVKITVMDHDKEVKNVSRNLIFYRQFQAKFYKKCLYWKRNLLFFLTMIAIPIFMTWLCFWLNEYLADRMQVELKMDASQIEKPFILVALRGDDIDKQRLKAVFNVLEKRMNVEVELLPAGGSFKRKIDEISQQSLLKYYDNLLGAIEFEENSLSFRTNILYSNYLVHSISILVNFVSNSMVMYNNGDSYSIEVTNSPLNRQDDNYIQNLYTEFVPIGLMLYMIMFLPFTFKEKATGFKDLQNIPGFIYWVSTYLSDLLVHMFVVVVIMLITFYDREGFTFTNDEISYMSIIFFIYGATNLVIIYITSQCFSSLNNCVMFLNYLQILSFFGVILMSSSTENMRGFSYLISIFHVFPDFSLKHSLKVIHQYHKFERNHIKAGNHKETEAFKQSYEVYKDVFDVTQLFIGNMFIFIMSCLFLFIFVENLQFMEQFNYFCTKLHSCCSRKKPNQRNNYMEMDARDNDVNREKNYVAEVLSKENTADAMLVSNLEKTYENGFKAVRGVSFSVKKSECFGLLGIHGAGKTSTFEMMTLSRPKKSGRMLINGVDSDDDSFLYRRMFGYCPQQDALCDYMTSREMLFYMLMINGYRGDINSTVNTWLRKMDLDEYSNRKVSTYSGGTKKKLNTAMAMISNPYIIFLDEPTTGIDPKSRRIVWHCIKSLQQQKKTVVLTSHSMDECEVLCNRLGIMKDGELKCIGYIQKLKEKYGKGLSIIIKVKQSNSDRSIHQEDEESSVVLQHKRSNIQTDSKMTQSCDSIDSGMSELTSYDETVAILKSKFSSNFTSELKDEHDGVLQYFVHKKDVKWTKVFENLLSFTTIHESLIESFSIQETTLEDIFQQLRNEQLSQQ